MDDTTHQVAAVGLTCDLIDIGSNAVRDDLQDRLHDVLRHEGESAGAHDAQLLILLCRNLVGGVVHITGVDKGERGDMRLKLFTACTPKRRVQDKVQWGQLHQRCEPVG